VLEETGVLSGHRSNPPHTSTVHTSLEQPPSADGDREARSWKVLGGVEEGKALSLEDPSSTTIGAAPLLDGSGKVTSPPWALSSGENEDNDGSTPLGLLWHGMR
jgi:hypothetical protein